MTARTEIEPVYASTQMGTVGLETVYGEHTDAVSVVLPGDTWQVSYVSS